MARNQTLTDLRVKSTTVLQEVPGSAGSAWQQPSGTSFVPGRKYKLQILFGNASAPIMYQDERFRKDLINIRIECKGFKVGDRYVNTALPKFYTDASFSRTVPGVAGSTSQVSFRLALPLETDDPDRVLDAFFRFDTAQLEQRPITTWVWRAGIYASVRNRVWRQVASSV